MPEVNQLSDAELAQRYVANDQDAAAALYHRYAWRLLVVARMSCARSFASRFDPEDAVQAAFQELFQALRTKRELLQSDADLWGLLVVITRCQVRRMMEHHSASKRAVQRTCPTEVAGDPIPVLDPHFGDPSNLLAVQEQLARLSDADRPVIELRLQGFEVGEISDQTGRPRRTVERILQAFRIQMADSI